MEHSVLIGRSSLTPPPPGLWKLNRGGRKIDRQGQREWEIPSKQCLGHSRTVVCRNSQRRGQRAQGLNRFKADGVPAPIQGRRYRLPSLTKKRSPINICLQK